MGGLAWLDLRGVMPKNMAAKGGGGRQKNIGGKGGITKKNSFKFCSDSGICDNRELKQRKRQRHRKRHPKSEFALLQTSPLLLQLL